MLIMEIEAPAGQKIRGLESSMCEGSHYKPPSMQEETFMFNDLSLETLGDVALITGQSPSWKGPNSVFRKPMLTQTVQGYFRKVFMTKYYLSDKKKAFLGL